MRRGDATRERILDAARALFGEQGFERTTIRQVAAAAAINPSMVIRYYRSKEGLFAAATEIDLRISDLTSVPEERRGETIVARRRMARDGMLIVALGTDRRPQIHGFGLPLDEDYAEFVAEAERDVVEALKRLKGPKARDREEVIEAARLAARRAAQRWSGKKPQTRVILLEDGGE